MPEALYEYILVESKPPKHPGPMVIHLYPDAVAHGISEKTFQLYTTDGAMNNPLPEYHEP
jgi:hypothetical protein